MARDRVKPMVSAGKTLADVKAAAPTKDLDQKWGQEFMNGDQFTEIVFRSYGGKSQSSVWRRSSTGGT